MPPFDSTSARINASDISANTAVLATNTIAISSIQSNVLANTTAISEKANKNGDSNEPFISNKFAIQNVTDDPFDVLYFEKI